MTKFVTYEFEVGDRELVVKNYGGSTYNVFLNGEEIDVFTAYADNEGDKEWIVNDWVTDWIEEHPEIAEWSFHTAAMDYFIP